MAEEIKELENETASLGRDEFLSMLLKIGAGTLAATIVGNGMLGTASKIIAKSKSETPVKRKYHYGMVIDTRRCVGLSCLRSCL